jgi:hypothetical protein
MSAPPHDAVRAVGGRRGIVATSAQIPRPPAPSLPGGLGV